MRTVSEVAQDRACTCDGIDAHEHGPVRDRDAGGAAAAVEHEDVSVRLHGDGERVAPGVRADSEVGNDRTDKVTSDGVAADPVQCPPFVGAAVGIGTSGVVGDEDVPVRLDSDSVGVAGTEVAQHAPGAALRVDPEQHRGADRRDVGIDDQDVAWLGGRMGVQCRQRDRASVDVVLASETVVGGPDETDITVGEHADVVERLVHRRCVRDAKHSVACDLVDEEIGRREGASLCSNETTPAEIAGLRWIPGRLSCVSAPPPSGWR